MFSDALGRSLEKRELDLSKVRQDMSIYISAHHDKRENKSFSLWTGKKTASKTSSPITCCICNRHIYANNPFLSLSHEYLLCQCCMLNKAVSTIHEVCCIFLLTFTLINTDVTGVAGFQDKSY